MLVVDELKKNEPSLRLVAVALAAGFCILLIGLWWIQVVSANEYRANLETQSFRTIRLPAVRGKILDREGRVLAENRPRYNLSLYLDDLRGPFYRSYTNLLGSARKVQKQKIAFAEQKLGRSLTKAELKQFSFKTEELEALRQQARAQVASQRLAEISRRLGQTVTLNEKEFKRHYATKRALPYAVLKNLGPEQIARFQESYTNGLGADMELESIRSYPNDTTAGHLLGYVLRDDDSRDGENAYFNYYLPDYKGQVGVEAGFDEDLRGTAGEEAVQVNSLGYRTSDNIENHPEPGNNVVLTLDLDLQRAAEKAIATRQGKDARAAAVVMDVRTGDVLAMVSSPSINPVYSENSSEWMTDEKLRPAINRATQDIFAPGSIFKVIVGLAALEAGLNPENFYVVHADPTRAGTGCIYVGKRKIEDTAPPGLYNFKLAIERSSNSYFITNGMRVGIDRIVALAGKFHLGEKANLPTRQETRGVFPTLKRVHDGWRDGDTANLCIGQGEVGVTPLQMAVAYSAIANGGTVFWPRLVSRLEPQDPASRNLATNLPVAQVRDHLGVSKSSLRVLHAAMLGETEDPEGTGRPAQVPGLRICGKTGTAQVQDSANRVTGWNYWFASFAPYENPRYAVVVLVQSENKGSGGGTCAPIAKDIYEAILENERAASPKLAAN